jgi:cbb3-type cytochrome oxidase subunit 3
MIIGIVRGVITLLLLLAFIGLLVWAWRGRQRPGHEQDVFDQMAKLPLDEDA